MSRSSNHIWKECAGPGLGYWRCGISYGWNLATCCSRYRILAPPFASARDAAGTLPGPRRAANRKEVTWLNCATGYNPGSGEGWADWGVRRLARRLWRWADCRVSGSYPVEYPVAYTVRWKGSEGSKQTKHTTRNLTPCWFQKCIFFENLSTPFFGNVCFVKFGTFSALLALPVMIRDGYGQIVYETLPHILLSNASLVTKPCIARFVEGDAFNPGALNDCSTGPSPPLAHAKSTLSPSRALSCLQPGLFGRFRSIYEQTAHRSRKIRAQCEITPFHVL